MKTEWRWAGALAGASIVLGCLLRCRGSPDAPQSVLMEAFGGDESQQARLPPEPEAASAGHEAARSPAQVPPTAKTESVSAPVALVQGRVLSDGGTSLIGARITLIQGSVAIAATHSREGGRYGLVLPDLPCGVVEIRCEAPGHRDEWLENVVVPGHYDFALQTAGHAAYGAVIGDRFGEPIAGAAVLCPGRPRR